MIKIFLEVVNNALIFAVTEQDDSLRNKPGEIKSFTAKNGVSIISDQHIYIGDDCVFIRGDKRDRDGEVMREYFDSGEDALEMKEKILEAFQEFKENDYFGGKKKVQKNPLHKSYYEF